MYCFHNKTNYYLIFCIAFLSYIRWRGAHAVAWLRFPISVRKRFVWTLSFSSFLSVSQWHGGKECVNWVAWPPTHWQTFNPGPRHSNYFYIIINIIIIMIIMIINSSFHLLFHVCINLRPTNHSKKPSYHCVPASKLRITAQNHPENMVSSSWFFLKFVHPLIQLFIPFFIHLY